MGFKNLIINIYKKWKLKKISYILVLFILLSIYISLNITGICHYVIAGGDLFVPVNSLEKLKIESWAYLENLYLGIPNVITNTYGLGHIIYHLFFSLFEIFGIGINISQTIWLFIIILSSLISMYLLVYSLTKNELSSIVSAIFYTFNPFLLTRYSPPYEFLISYSLLPLTLFFCLKYAQNFNIKKCMYLALFIVFYSSVAIVNIPTWLIFVLVPFIYLIYLTIITDKKSLIKNLAYVLIVFVLVIILYIPFIFTFLLSLNNEVSIETNNENYLHFTNVNNTLINIFLLKGYWAFNSYAFGSPYFPYAKWYSTTISIVLGVFILCVALTAILLKFYDSKEDYNFYFFVIMFIISIFLAKGINPPFGNLYAWLYKNFPLFWMYREPWTKFMMLFVLSFSVLLGYSTNIICKKLEMLLENRRIVYLFCILLSLAICIYSWPFFTGDVIPGDRGYYPGLRVEIPTYWFKASNYINNYIHDDSRILLLPSNPFFQMHYFWWNDGYYGVDPTLSFIFKPVIYEDQGGGYVKPENSIKIINLFYQTYLKENYPIWKPLAIMNVKYILYRKDLDWTQIGTRNSPEEPKVVKERLQKEPCINLVASFGKFDLEKIKTDQWFLNYIIPKYPYLLNESVLDFYKIDNNYTLPHIYTASTLIIINGTIKDMFSVIISDNYNIDNSIIILSNQTNKVQWQFLKNRNSSIIITKHTISTKPVNGNKKPFNWNNLPNNSIEARYYIGWKSVIRTDGKEPEDTLTFPSLKDCPYKFPSYSSTGWSALNSTLIYIKTGNKPLVITKIEENGKHVEDIIGIWWETGWMGMGTNPIEFPVLIPPHQKAIIQIGHIIRGNITICSLDLTNLTKLNEIKTTSLPTITFKKINPTKYIISVENATKPFFLVFSESYFPQWKIYIEDKPTKFNKIIAEYPKVHVKEAKHDWYKFTPEDIIFLFKKPAVNETLHFMANGYANAWYIDPKEFDKDGDGKFTIIIYFLPQSLFYLGLFISGITLLCCIGYLIYDWRRGKGDKWAKTLESKFKNFFKIRRIVK